MGHMQEVIIFEWMVKTRTCLDFDKLYEENERQHHSDIWKKCTQAEKKKLQVQKS